MPCACGCTQPVAWRDERSLGLRLVTPFGRTSISTHATAQRVTTPAALAAAYKEMVGHVHGLRRPPKLEFYNSLHGVGGLFIADQGVIAVGMEDGEAITDDLLSRYPEELAALARELAREKGIKNPDIRQVVLGGVLGRITAHELG